MFIEGRPVPSAACLTDMPANEVDDYILIHLFGVIADDTAFQAQQWDVASLIVTMEGVGYLDSVTVRLHNADLPTVTSTLTSESIVPVIEELSTSTANDDVRGPWRVAVFTIRKADGDTSAKYYYADEFLNSKTGE
jgi:hypothetical protein